MNDSQIIRIGDDEDSQSSQADDRLFVVRLPEESRRTVVTGHRGDRQGHDDGRTKATSPA